MKLKAAFFFLNNLKNLNSLNSKIFQGVMQFKLLLYHVSLKHEPKADTSIGLTQMLVIAAVHRSSKSYKQHKRFK